MSERLRVGYVLVMPHDFVTGCPDLLTQTVYADPYTAKARADRFAKRSPGQLPPTVCAIYVDLPFPPPPPKDTP